MSKANPTLVTDGGTEPLDDGLKDICSMSTQERYHLMGGQIVNIACLHPHSRARKDCTIEVPLRAIRALSGIANTHFLAGNTQTLYISSEGAVVSSVREIVNWIRVVCSAQKCFPLLPRGNWLSNVSIYQAMQTLAMEPCCSRGLLTQFYREISSRQLSLAELSDILTHLGPLDPVYQHLAHTYADRRFKNDLEEPEEFTKWLENWPEFKQQLAEVDKKNRQRVEEAMGPWLGSQIESPPRKPGGGEEAEEAAMRSEATIAEGQGEEHIDERSVETTVGPRRINEADVGSVVTVEEAQQMKEPEVKSEAAPIGVERTKTLEIKSEETTTETQENEIAEFEGEKTVANAKEKEELQKEEARPTPVKAEAPRCKGKPKWKPLVL